MNLTSRIRRAYYIYQGYSGWRIARLVDHRNDNVPCIPTDVRDRSYNSYQEALEALQRGAVRIFLEAC